MTVLDETFDVVRCYDPAIIAANPDEAVIKYMGDREIKALDVPAEAWVFKCRLLTRPQVRLVRMQSNPAGAYELAFRYSVLQVTKGAGPIEPTRSRAGEPITDAGMDNLKVGFNAEQEIGMVIQSKSFLDPDVPLSCPQLASSVRAYSVVAVRHAAQKTDSSTPTDE